MDLRNNELDDNTMYDNKIITRVGIVDPAVLFTLNSMLFSVFKIGFVTLCNPQ